MNLGCKLAIVFSGALLFTVAARAQSLGDVARQNQQKMQNQTSPTVLTNDDLPKSGLADEDAEPQSSTGHAGRPHATTKATSGKDAAALSFRARILNQKSSIAALRARIDNVQASTRFARDPYSYYAAQTNERAQAKVQEAKDLKHQLEIDEKKLEDLQEEARRAGYGNAIYEP
jgi:hypothetical protein